jgi:imidazoleglycerol phosphate synthase cyclase subunit
MTLATRLVPCLDIKDGRVVKGIRFQRLRDVGDPVAQAEIYERQGADEIVLLDVSATTEGRSHSLDTVRKVREVLGIPLTVGGGVRKPADAAALLEAGADKVGVNTAAVNQPELVSELAEIFGSQCVVLSVDASAGFDQWDVRVASGRVNTGLDAVEWCRRATELGAGEILLTSWDRDGTGDGYDTSLIAAVSSTVTVPLIASGGASGPAHLAEAVGAGASAVLVASMLHDGDFTVTELKKAMAGNRIQVRL